MRFVHTADWHLGRTLHGVRLLEEQETVLGQIVDLVEEAEVDVLLVAGDIYDRAVPPHEAVALLDRVLERVVLEQGVPVVVIAGNHDGPDRLAFASGLLERQGLHVVGTWPGEPRPVVLEDEHGPVHVHGIPYAEPAVCREWLGDDRIRDHASAMDGLTDRVRATTPAGVRSIVCAHAFVAGARTSDSERPLSVGGAGTVDASSFRGFDYVALGHLHRPQVVEEGIRYAGSVYRYSFSEVADRKVALVGDLDGSGRVDVEPVPLEPDRRVRKVSGRLEEILERDPIDDYLLCELTDREALLDPMGKLRRVHPNVLHVERPELDLPERSGAPAPEDLAREPDDLFEAFFAEVTGEEPTEAEAEAFRDSLEALRRREREVAS